MRRRGHDLDEVVGGHVRGHAHGDAGSAVDEEVGEGRRQDLGLLELAVVVRDEVHDVFVEVLGEGERGRREAGFRIARGGGAVVEGAEVAVAVDEGNAQGEGLCQAHESVVDRGVAVRVQLSHHLADDTRALDVPAVRSQSEFGHLVENAPLHRLESVPRIRERARVDHRVRVLEERPLHLCGDVDVFDAFFGLRCGVGAGHEG